jgi:uncharacterized protein DUF4232
MSDERFDQDLRSVLLDDAPRDVPEDLRRRVEAIPALHPAPSTTSRPVWRRPVPLWAGALAAVVVLAVGLWRFGPAGQPGIGAPPSPTAPPPSSSADGPACLGADLEATIVGWQGAAGSRIADIAITNTATHSCFVRGTPGLQLVDATGRVLIDSTTAGPSGQPRVTPTDPSLELAPGGQVRTEVRVSNYCGPTPEPPIDIALTLPSGGGQFIAKAATGISSADAVPPCLGSTGSLIEMNGWRR